MLHRILGDDAATERYGTVELSYALFDRHAPPLPAALGRLRSLRAFIVRDYDDQEHRRKCEQRLTKDEARRMAVNFARPAGYC